MKVGRKMLCVCCDGGGCAQPHATGEHKQEWDNTKVEIDNARWINIMQRLEGT